MSILHKINTSKLMLFTLNHFDFIILSFVIRKCYYSYNLVIIYSWFHFLRSVNCGWIVTLYITLFCVHGSHCQCRGFQVKDAQILDNMSSGFSNITSKVRLLQFHVEFKLYLEQE